jgi:hypothetical protein
MKRTLWSIGVLLFLAHTAAFAGGAPSLMLGSLSGQAGKTIALPITFDPASSSVSSLQFNLTLPKGLHFQSVDPGPVLASAGKGARTNVKGRTCTVVVFGINQNTIASGQLLTANLKIAPGTAAGNLSVPVSGVVYTDPKGNTVAAGAHTGGTVTVVGAP